MSVSAKGNLLPKTGKTLHRAARVHMTEYELAIARALKTEFESAGASVKTVMRWTGASERTVKGWLAGSFGPSAKHLILLAASSDAVFVCLLALCGRPAIVQARQLSEVRDAMATAVQAIDAFVQE
jgi:hypothetical protein